MKRTGRRNADEVKCPGRARITEADKLLDRPLFVRRRGRVLSGLPADPPPLALRPPLGCRSLLCRPKPEPVACWTESIASLYSGKGLSKRRRSRGGDPSNNSECMRFGLGEPSLVPGGKARRRNRARKLEHIRRLLPLQSPPLPGSTRCLCSHSSRNTLSYRSDMSSAPELTFYNAKVSAISSISLTTGMKRGPEGCRPSSELGPGGVVLAYRTTRAAKHRSSTAS